MTATHWIQLTLSTSDVHGELVGTALTAAGALAVTLHGGGDDEVLEPAPGATPLWKQIRVVGLFAADVSVDAVVARVRAQTGHALIGEPRVSTLADQAWERTCLADFQTMRFGARTWICPSWSETPPEPDAVIIRLDPGLAFGTGSHPTTALCLEWLDAHPPVDRQVIDYGCGSGILGICAAHHGAARVWSVDHDHQALRATNDNAAHNQVADRIETRTAQHAADIRGDVLLANILAAPLIELAPRFATLLRPGGDIVLAGLLSAQTAAVIQAYRPWVALRAEHTRDDWVLLTGRRPLPGERDNVVNSLTGK
jgi:ribosomal protein L11 methyltransferase